MAKNTYNISLKGYVGGADFDRKTVDRTLSDNSDKAVHVLIDSLGGSLATGLSISAAFKNHGNVNVHFVGLNASAATIASLGAKHISMDSGAMYLVHQCSMAFFEWGSLNSSQFDSLIADCEKIKADLDKLDLNCAQLYASRCKRKTEDLLALMKVGGWLTAKEALEWGFVDEITAFVEESSPVLTDALASSMASVGMPIPHIPIAEMPNSDQSVFAKFIASLTSFFATKSQPTSEMKTYKGICAVIGASNLQLVENQATLTDEQLSALDTILAENFATIADLKAQVASLQAQPAASTTAVVENHKTEEQPRNEVESFVATYNSALRLFNEV